VPELPEVETLRRGLEKGILNRRIVRADVANAKVLKEQTEAAFRERIVGKRIEHVDRRGKYLLVALTAERTDVRSPSTPPSDNGQRVALGEPPVLLCIHLKMRGQLLLQKVGEPTGPYHCVSLLLDDGMAIRFHDMWTWGEMRALTGDELAKVAGLAGMGAEPLDPAWDGRSLAAQLAKRSAPIKPTLLDQRVVAGIGNIYADEALFRAGIHPERPAASLTEAETDCLMQTIRAVLSEAVEGGGTTSDEYVDVEGVAGRYTPRVYDRGGQPCVVCGTPLTRIRLGGRGTVYCAQCQAPGPTTRGAARGATVVSERATSRQVQGTKS
jgi:formamidopyrimidine-DNA glycosylase